MEGGWCSKWGSRLGAAGIRLKSLQQLQGWRAGRFQNGALALVPHALVYLKRYIFSKDVKAQWFASARPHFLINVRPMGRLSFKGARPGVKRNACIDL